jgi:hypothetical protein
MVSKNLFVVRKYIMAKSAAEAIRKDKHTAVDEVWVDDDWKKNGNLASAIGFVVQPPSEDA